MRTLQSFSGETWDRFFVFAYDDERPPTDDEVRERLRAAGIDMRPAYERLHAMIDAAKRGVAPARE